MAQNKTSVNLSSADFTLSFSFKGRSVVVPGQDQNFFGSTGAWAGNMPQKGVNIPQVYYCENTVPTSEGYRSVAYRFAIDPPATTERFVKILNLFDGNANSAILGITADLKLFVLGNFTAGLWTELALPEPFEWTEPSLVTATTVIGFVGICIQGVGVFNLSSDTGLLVHAPLTGVDSTLIYGICASNSILVVWDKDTVYWSSALYPLDFTPSLITGAGSAKPEGLKGNIMLCKEVKGGFIVYSDVTIIGVQYTQNNAIPWIFDSMEGASGVISADHVAYDINMSAHFAWTTAGLMQVQVNSIQPLFPELTDFIASGLKDSTVSLTDYPVRTFSEEAKEIRLAAISSRYLCISFGYLSAEVEGELRVPNLVQSFLYDSQLKRWGKLNISHIQILEAPFTADPPVFF